MSKPNIDIPSGFAGNGTKEDFPNDKILNGFDPINPDILPGDCLNKFIDDTYKGLNGVLELYEGCVLYDSTVTYTNKSLVFDITNDGIKFYHSLQNGNTNNPLTDTDYWEEVNLGGSTRNVCEVITSTLPLTDAGLHLLDGTLLQYGIYQEFIDYIADLYTANPTANYFTTEALWQNSVTQYGSCGKFVYDSVNKTVRLPKVSDILQSTTDINALGDLIEAGLPNITGNTAREIKSSSVNVPTTEWYGAMGYRTGSSGSYGGSGTTYKAAFLYLDASKSNPIYGNSNTVQPQTIKAFVYIVIANSTKTSIQVDIDEIATDLNNKAGTDLANVTDTGKILMSGMGMPSDKYIDLTLGASGSTYTAPANGWVLFGGGSTSGNKGLTLSNKTANFSVSGITISGISNCQLSLPVKSGDVFKTDYTANSAFTLKFIYAQGAESEAN